MITIKILIVTSYTWNHLGGITTYMSALKQGLEKKGHHTETVAFDPRSRSYKFIFSEKSLPKTKISELLSEKLAAYSRQAGVSWQKAIRRRELRKYYLELTCAFHGLGQYDVIHAQDAFAAYAISRVKPLHVPLLLTIHGAMYDKHLLKRGKKSNNLTSYVYQSEKMALNVSDKIMCPSKWMSDRLRNSFQITPKKLSIIRYGLDIDVFKNRMEQDIYDPQKPTHKKVILCSARIAKEKGISFLLHALSSLRRVRDDWVCWIAGDGPAKDLMSSLSNQLGLHAHVRFLGRREDIPALLKHADLFVLPSLLDNLPYAIMEAQIAGKATITTKTGGIPEMVPHGHTGLVVPPADCEALSSAMKFLLENDGERARLAANAKKWAIDQWPLSKMIDRTINFYGN